jgi:hypothetical protein
LNGYPLKDYDEAYNIAPKRGQRFGSIAKGWSIGSGNSIPGYVPEDNLVAMIDVVNEIRAIEKPN